MCEKGYCWVKISKDYQPAFDEWEVGYHFGGKFDVFNVLDFELELGREICEIDERRIKMDDD